MTLIGTKIGNSKEKTTNDSTPDIILIAPIKPPLFKPSCNNKWINVFKYFTNNAHIWPRGYPLSLIKSEQNIVCSNLNKTPAIINGLVENDPDVDALFRLISKDNIEWEKNKKILISNKTMAVFNTQNTFWINKDIFICLFYYH